MGQWRINEYGKRVRRSRGWRRRANRVWFYGYRKYNDKSVFVYTQMPRSELAYPVHYKYALKGIYVSVKQYDGGKQ
jgi:hypothetical protein